MTSVSTNFSGRDVPVTIDSEVVGKGPFRKFKGTLAFVPVVPGSVTFEAGASHAPVVTSLRRTMTACDDGAGQIIGDAEGEIDYDTGKFNLCFRLLVVKGRDVQGQRVGGEVTATYDFVPKIADSLERLADSAETLAREALRQQAEKFIEGHKKDCCKRCGNKHEEGRLYECQKCGAVLCRKQIVVQDTTGVLFHEIDKGVVEREGQDSAAWMNCYCGPCKVWKNEPEAS